MSEQPVTAVYPGSFDPFHLGHLDIVRRAITVFPRIVVGVLRNADKTPLLPPEQRVELIRTTLNGMPGVEVTPPHALVTVDGTSIGRADNGDHTRADKKIVFARPGRHSVKLSAPGFRTTWIAVVVDPRAEEETAEIDTRLPPQ